MIIDHKINKSLNTLRDTLTSEFLCYLSKYGNNITQNKRTLTKKAVGCFLLNTYTKCSNKQYRAYLTLNKNHFNTPAIINGQKSNRKVSYQYFRSLLDFLNFEDYILLEKGKVDKFTFRNGYYEILESTATSIVMNNKLIRLMKREVDWVTEQRSNVIFLKNKKKETVTFKMGELTREVKQYLDGYNKFSLGCVVECRNKVYDVQIFKVYNDSSFNKGARSYMSDSIQGLNKKDRQSMTINNQEVCVYDFKGFEPSLTYSLCQEIMPFDDPYEIELDNIDKLLLRKLAKSALLIMLNAESKEEATAAFNLSVAKDYSLSKLYEGFKIPTKYIPTKIIMQLMEEKHHLISHRFYKGFGKDIMYMGSLVNDYILGSMMQNHKVLVVQTHDEFACDEKYREELYETMVNAYDYVTGIVGNCRITKEK